MRSALISITQELCERGRKRSAVSLALFNFFRMWVLQIQTFAQYKFQIIHINGTGIHNLLYIQPSFKNYLLSKTTRKKKPIHFNLWKEEGEWRESNTTTIICARRKREKWAKHIVKWLQSSNFVQLNPGLPSSFSCVISIYYLKCKSKDISSSPVSSPAFGIPIIPIRDVKGGA